MNELYNKLLDYLEANISNFKIDKKGKVNLLTCPSCGQQTAVVLRTVAQIPFLKCNRCHANSGNIIDLVRVFEPEKSQLSEDEIIDYLVNLYSLDIITKTKIDKIFDLYNQWGFDLVPIQRNGKIPIEKSWTQKQHKDVQEWKDWLDNDYNIGVKTGLCSNITVIDVDSFDCPEEFKVFFENYKGLSQKTSKGSHYFFKYVKELPKRSFDINSIHIDIENDGGQVVIFPSVIDNIRRKLVNAEFIPEMPKELLTLLLKYVPTRVEEVSNEVIIPNDIGTLPDIKAVNEGSRNTFLTHFGGILRKELNLDQTRYVLDIVNNKFLNPPISSRELYTIINSLQKYVHFEEKDLAAKVLNYLKTIGDATARDVKEVTGETKEKVDKTLAFLVKEGYLIKHKRMFQMIRRAIWKDTFDNLTNSVPFKIPFFEDYANFCWGDLILLGSKSKWGKTTIAMNILKSFIDQGIKPYYLSLETGSRFIKTATHLGINEGQFYWAFEADPTKIELEPNAITIIDWLLVEDKSQTDVIFKHFVEQLYKTNGLLIVFMQLKEGGGWFAENMTNQFPAFSARYLYDSEDGSTGNWHIDAIRDAKCQMKTTKVPCRYDWNERTLKLITKTDLNGKGI